MKLLIIASSYPFTSAAILFFRCYHHSQMALANHTTLEGVTRLKLLPPVHSTNLDTDELLVRILRPEIGRSLRLLDPRVPHNGVFEVVVLKHGGGVLLDGLVDAVGLAGDLDGRVGLRVFGGVEDLVGVGRGA
jgi:hypothetical protein